MLEEDADYDKTLIMSQVDYSGQDFYSNITLAKNLSIAFCLFIFELAAIIESIVCSKIARQKILG